MYRELLCLIMFWVDAQKVSKELIEVWSFMQQIMNYWMLLTCSEQPETRGFEAVKKAVKDTLIVTK